MSLLGLDIGTTNCKAVVFGEAGQAIATAYREYPTHHPREGWAQLDAEQVLASVRQTIAQAAAESRRDPVTALSVSSMGEAATPIDHAGRIVGPCILFSDTRGAEQWQRFAGKIRDQDLYAINPNPPGVAYTLPKLLWLREHQPDLWRRTHRVLLWDGMLALALGVEPFASHSLANRTRLFDIRAENWSDKLLKLADIDPGMLPRILPAGTIAGTVPHAIADSLNLARNAALVVGGHDQCCNALGAGICKGGQAVDGIGTVECITPVYRGLPDFDTVCSAGMNIEHHVTPGHYVSFLYNQAGALLKWFRDTFAPGEGADIYDRLNAEMPEGPTRLLVLPYFEMSGPPQYIADASGVIMGLKTTTTRGEIFKAFLESITYYFMDAMGLLRQAGIDTSRFVATGGGAKSDRWMQIKADIAGVPYARPAITECSSLGAAMLAGVATGQYASQDQAVEQFVHIERTFQPDPARQAIYREQLDRYRQLWRLINPFLRQQTPAPS